MEELDLTNSNKLDEGFSNFTLGRHPLSRRGSQIIYPTFQPRGERLEDEFGGSANYVPFNNLNNFSNAVPVIEHVGDMDYELTPYGYTTDEYSEISGKRKEKREKRKERKSHRKERRDEIKKNLKAKVKDGKAIHAVNKFNPVFLAMRGAVLSILNINLVGMASAMDSIKQKSPKHWKELQDKWFKWGGDKGHWDKAVEKGKKKKPLLKNAIEKVAHKKGFDGGYSYANGDENAGTAVLIASALLGISTPILASNPATAPISVYTGAGAGAFGAMGGILKSFAQEQGVPESELSNIPQTPEIPDAPIPTDENTLNRVAEEIDNTDEQGNKIDDDDILGIPKTAFWIGVGALVLIGGFIVYKKFIAKK